MNRVNYGTPVEWVSEPFPPAVGRFRFVRTCTFVHARHTGEDGHDQMKPGEQCECGVLELGIVRKP